MGDKLFLLYIRRLAGRSAWVCKGFVRDYWLLSNFIDFIVREEEIILHEFYFHLVSEGLDYKVTRNFEILRAESINTFEFDGILQ